MNESIVSAAGMMNHLTSEFTPYLIEQIDYKSILANYVEDSYLIVDTNLHIVDFGVNFSAQYLKYFGRDVKKGASILDYAPQGRQEVVSSFYRWAMTGETIENEVELPMPDKTVMSYKSKYKPIYDKNEKIVGVFVSTINTSLERKAGQTESNMKAIFDNTSEAFLLLDTQCNIKAFNNNARLLGLLGKEQEIEEGRHILDFIEDERKAILQSYIDKVLAGKTVQYDRPYLQGNSKLWINYSISPVIENGQIKGICSTGRDITARKTAEEEIAKRETKLRSILANSHDFLFLYDEDKKIEFLSPIIEKVFGYKNSANEIPNILNNIHPDDLESVLSQLHQAFISPEEPITASLRMRSISGNYVWLEGTFTNMLMVKEVNAVVGNFKDVSERKASEEHQAFLAAIINNSDDAIVSIDTDKNILSWNKGAEKMYGYTSAEIVGKSIYQIVPLNLYHEEDSVFDKIFKGEVVRSFETRRRTKWDELIDISLTTSPIKDSNNKVIGVSKIARDISEKKQAEEKIRSNEKRFRSLLKNSNDGLFLMNLDGVILEISQTGKHILGYDETDLVGKTRYDLVHPDDLNRVADAFIDVAKNSEKTSYFEYRSLGKDGNYKWLEASYQNLLNDPAVGAIVVNFRDITERKSLEIEREKLIDTLNTKNADLRNFSFIISHNLRAPLSNLLGFVSLLQDINIEDAMLKDICESFKTSTMQLDNTLNDLTDVILIREKTFVEQKDLKFDEVFTQVKSQISHSLHEIQPEIEIDFKHAPAVFFNEAYLTSILLNLLTNAIKYRAYDRPLKIKVETQKNTKGIVLTFTDNGIGFDIKRYKDRVFGLYQRFHDRAYGKGLGLFMIKTQMESLGGSIEVESTVDVGTTFRLRFNALPMSA